MTPERRDEIALRVVSVVVTGSLALALAGLTWRLTGWDDGRDEVAVADRLVVSPGVPVAEPLIQAAMARGGAPADTAERLANLDRTGAGPVAAATSSPPPR